MNRALVDADHQDLSMQMNIFSWIKGRKACQENPDRPSSRPPVARTNFWFTHACAFSQLARISASFSVCSLLVPLAATRRELFLDILGRIIAVPGGENEPK